MEYSMIKRTGTIDAILAINPDAKITIHTPNDGSAETIEWLEETAEISQKDIDAKKVELETEWNSQAYARARKPLYPDIGDQLDDLYKEGVFSASMAAKIKKVKDDNPKG